MGHEVPPRSTARDVRSGVVGGLAVATLYCLWIAAIYVFRGPAAFERQGVRFGSLLLTYLTIGIVSGALVGLLKPLARWKSGAYAVGLIAGAPVAIGLAVCIKGMPSNWDADEAFVIPILSVVAGLAIGSEIWKASLARRAGDAAGPEQS